MKFIVLASALAASMLVGPASGLPFFNKRAVVTEVVYVTETVANVFVYVDENGSPYSTTTADLGSTSAAVITSPASEAPTSISASVSAVPPASPDLPASSPAVSSSQTAVKLDDPQATTSTTVAESPAATEAPPSTSSTIAAPTTVAKPDVPEPVASSATPQQPSAAPSNPAVKDDGNGSIGLGITYDPYTGSQGNTQCKSAQDISNDFAKMKDYKAVRIYGDDCGIIPVAIQNALKNGQNLMAGVYMKSQGGQDLSQVIQEYKKAIDENAKGSWDVINLFSVENERVNEHDMTVSAVVDAINRARKELNSVGYYGPVGAVETVPATVDNPAICENSDVVMVNSHAFFDRNTEAKNAGTFVKSEIERVKKACNNKRVVVTESGWPHQGNANGAAVPSVENQRLAIESLRQNFNSDMFLFNAFDCMWKTDWASSFNAERFWGILQ